MRLRNGTRSIKQESNPGITYKQKNSQKNSMPTESGMNDISQDDPSYGWTSTNQGNPPDRFTSDLIRLILCSLSPELRQRTRLYSTREGGFDMHWEPFARVYCTLYNNHVFTISQHDFPALNDGDNDNNNNNTDNNNTYNNTNNSTEHYIIVPEESPDNKKNYNINYTVIEAIGHRLIFLLSHAPRCNITLPINIVE